MYRTWVQVSAFEPWLWENFVSGWKDLYLLAVSSAGERSVVFSPNPAKGSQESEKVLRNDLPFPYFTYEGRWRVLPGLCKFLSSGSYNWNPAHPSPPWLTCKLFLWFQPLWSGGWGGWQNISDMECHWSCSPALHPGGQRSPSSAGWLSPIIWNCPAF